MKNENNKFDFLLEHRTLTDKNNETFHLLHFWDGEKWISLNNIWG